MKTNAGGIVTPINKKEIKELLKETNETLATDMLKNNSSGSRFGVIDLWRMNKKRKTIGSSTRW